MQKALRLIFPKPCFGCNEAIVDEPAELGLCPRCDQMLSPPPEPACRGCGRALPAGTIPEDGALCDSCEGDPPEYDELWSAWDYHPPIDRIILGLKHRRLDYLGRTLGADLVQRFGARCAEIDRVVPVPTLWWRKALRGYNHAERIARPVATLIDRPIAPLLRRSPLRGRQKGKGRARRLENLRGAFRCRRSIDGEAILLVDDVATTGATLGAAAEALKAAGASRVVALVVARRGPD